MASTSDQFFVDPCQSNDWVDFDQFLNLPAYGDESSAMASSTPDMALPYDADMLGGNMPEFMQPAFPESIDHDIPQQGFLADQSPSVGLMPDLTPGFDDAMCDGSLSYDDSFQFQFRQMVEAQAAADQSVASIKEKRREASIALHLQRLCDATALDLDMSSDSNTSFSSPSWSDYMRESISPQPATVSHETTPAPPSAAGNGGVELVLDLNMNTTTNLPKKQKPRSQAQKENYIKARKYGACEKHKKQHKRCNCLEKAAARAGLSDVPMEAGFKERRQQSSTPLPVLPDMRSSSVPGHDPSRILSMPRPSAKLAPQASSSPGHDPNTCRPTPTVPQLARATLKTSNSTAGHDPQHSVPGLVSLSKGINRSSLKSHGHDSQHSGSTARAFVKDTGKNPSSSPGHEPSAWSPTRPSLPQGSLQTTIVQPTLRWRTQKISGNAVHAVAPTDSNSPRHTSPTTNRPDTGTLQRSILEVRRPKAILATRPAEQRSLSSMAAPNEKQSHPGVWSPGRLAAPGTDRVRSNVLQAPRKPLSGLTSWLESIPKDQCSILETQASPGSFVPISQLACYLVTQTGGVLTGALSAISGAWRSSSSLTSWSEGTVLKCLSFAGKNLMSAKRGVQLFQRQTFGSA